MPQAAGQAVPRVIEGVLRRMSEEFAATPPSHCVIHRSDQRWRELIELLTSVPKGQALPEELLADESEHEPEAASPEEEVDKLQFQAPSFHTGKRQSKIGRPTKKLRRDLGDFMGEEEEE